MSVFVFFIVVVVVDVAVVVDVFLPPYTVAISKLQNCMPVTQVTVATVFRIEQNNLLHQSTKMGFFVLLILQPFVLSLSLPKWVTSSIQPLSAVPFIRTTICSYFDLSYHL